MSIKIIEDETGDILSPADVHAMRLPFQHGWSAWGVFDELGRLIERFTSFRAAVAFEKSGRPVNLPLAA